MAQAKIAVVQGPAKFGFNALFHPTPETAKLIARVVLYGAGILVGIMNIVTEIPEPIKVTISKYAAEAVSIVYLICHMFGIEPDGPNTSNVQAKSYRTTQ